MKDRFFLCILKLVFMSCLNCIVSQLAIVLAFINLILLTINRQQYIIHFPPILFFFPIITKGILEEKKEKGYIGGSNLFR